MIISTWLTIAWNSVAYFLLGLTVMFTGGGVWRCIAQATKGEELITRTGLPAYVKTIPGAKIHFLSTGSSDAILLESDGHFALVDCAEAGYKDYVLGCVKRTAAGTDGKVTLDFVLCHR